jgi:hypothetical protein
LLRLLPFDDEAAMARFGILIRLRRLPLSDFPAVFPFDDQAAVARRDLSRRFLGLGRLKRRWRRWGSLGWVRERMDCSQPGCA